MLFVIPWGEHWIIGTTDTDWELDLAHPAASRSDVDYLLEHANRLLKTPLTHEDVVGVYAGLRPLLSGESDDTSQLSREHAVVSPVAGLVMVAGGKYTTYRVMAKDAVDAVVARPARRKVPACCTETIPLVGAEGYAALWNQREQLAAESGLHRGASSTCWAATARWWASSSSWSRSGPTLAEPLPDAPDYLRVEAYYAALARGRPAPRRRPDPADPDLDRDRGPRRRRRRGGRRAGGPGAGLGGRAGQATRSSTTAPGSRPSWTPSSSPTTAPPTPPGSARRTCGPPPRVEVVGRPASSRPAGPRSARTGQRPDRPPSRRPLARTALGIVVPRPCSIVTSWANCCSAFSVRANVVSASGGLNRCRAIACG